jgi:hypothetical protein
MKKVAGLLAAVVWMTTGLSGQTGKSYEGVFESLTQVSSDGEGVMVGLNAKGKVFAWNGAEWKQIAGELAQVSIGSKTEIWGVNADHVVWRLGDTAWERKPGLMKHVAVAKGGAAVVAVDLNGKAMSWNFGANAWQPFPSSPVLKQIAIGKTSRIYGIGENGEIAAWRPATQTWVRIKGSLQSISVGLDGTIGGVGAGNKAWLRAEADVDAELTGAAAQQGWLPAETQVKGYEVVDGRTAVMINDQNLLVQRDSSVVGLTGILSLDGELVTAPVYEDRPPAVVYNPKTCQAPRLLFSSTTTLPFDSCLARYFFVPPGEAWKVPTFSSIVAVPSEQGPAVDGRDRLGSLFNYVSTYSPATSASGSTAPIPEGLQTSFDYIARSFASLQDNGPNACAPRHFRSVSNHSWVEFRLPEAKASQVISIPAGAYNNYVFPACNRVWWDTLVFGCDPNDGWKLLLGAYDADGWCHGSPGDSPYVAYGNR